MKKARGVVGQGSCVREGGIRKGLGVRSALSDLSVLKLDVFVIV